MKSAAEAGHQVASVTSLFDFMARYKPVFISLVAALHSSYYVSSRMKAMVEVPCRPTMQEIQDRRRSSITEHKLSKRRGLSLPNLEVAHSISFQRDTIVTGIIMPGSGEEVWADEMHLLTLEITREDQTFVSFSPLVVTFSSSLPFISPCVPFSLCLPALRTTPNLVKMFKLPEFPASLSIHSVQSYYSELIQQLGKAIFSARNDNPALLARYSASVVP